MRRFFPYFKNKEYLLSAGSAFLLLSASLVVNFYAGLYATEAASNSVTDVVLSNVPVFDVDGIFVYGTIAFWIFVISLFFWRPRIMPFTLKSIAVFTLVRSVFINLTHIGPFPSRITVDSNLLNKFTFGGDLFFSGHTGLPFLMALIFWDHRPLRLIFFATSISFGTVVLLAHLHYSIDVLAAFFITYSIFHITERLFKRDRALFFRGL